jgi:hypothetical protein
MSQTIPPQPVKRTELVAPHRILRWIFIGFIMLVVAGLVIWEVVRVTAPPDLAVFSPADNLLTPSHRVTLEGKAAPGAMVTANGATVPISLDGSFKEDLDLRTGANVITIIASKKFAKPNTIYRRVVVSE